MTAFGELDIGTAVPPLILPLPIPLPPSTTLTTTTATTSTTTTTTTTNTILETNTQDEEKEDLNNVGVGNNRQLSSDTHIDVSRRAPPEDMESIHIRNESEDIFQDEFSSSPHLDSLPPVIKPISTTTTSNKNRINFRAALKGKKVTSSAVVTTTK